MGLHFLFLLIMLRLFVIALCLTSCLAQSNPPAKSWPSAWNATVSITMGDIVVGAPANTYYDASRQMQATFFTQCGIAGGIVNNEPCTQVQSSVEGNFGIWTITGDSCCVDFENVGFIVPSWTSTLSYVGTQMVFGQEAIHYAGGTPDNHDYYVTNDANQTPIFVGPEEWTWFNGWTIGPQPDVFSNLMPISSCVGKCAAS